MTNVSPNIRNYFKLERLVEHGQIPLRQLFKNRYALFYPGSTWDDTQTWGSNYLANVIMTDKRSKKERINPTPEQKTAISNGDSNEWDIALLLTLLLHGNRPTTLDQQQLQQIDQENKLLEQLKELRNKIIHHPSKSIDDIEFNQLWSDLTALLVSLGAIGSELDKLKDDSIFDDRSQPINQENVEEAKRLNSLGTQAHKDEKYADAITFFIKATDLCGVADHDRAVFHSNMSSSRLALYEQQPSTLTIFETGDTKDERYRALQDAKTARKLHLIWWKGHYRVGKAYASMNEHEKAIDSFETALVLDPTKTEIQKALDESQYAYAFQSQLQHLDPREPLKTMSEELKEVEKNLGTDPQRLRLSHMLLEARYPSAGNLLRGHKYLGGDTDVKQDFKKAAEYFDRAAKQGNAEGMYYLAMMLDRGLGVKKDHNLALELLKHAADQSPQHPFFSDLPNDAVAAAENALAARYFHGVTVPKSLPTAVYWYQRASDHGSAEAAFSLGLMCYNGLGVDKNIAKAEELFQLSADRGDQNAMLTVAKLLFNKNDLAMAKIWYDRACDAGNIHAQMERDDFLKVLQGKQHLSNNTSPKALEIWNTLQNMFNALESGHSAGTMSKSAFTYDYSMLLKYANRGSVTAKKMCNALKHFYEALAMLLENDSLTEEQENTLVHELSQCYRIELIVVEIPSIEMRERIVAIIDRVLHRCTKRYNNTTSQLDEDVRLCYVASRMDEHESNLKFLKQCQQKYPKSIAFYEYSVSMNGFLQQYEDALHDANRGLEIDPNNVGLLYDKAGALRLMNRDMGEAIKAYKAFLLMAPQDHRKVPDVYYTLGLCYPMHDKHKNIEDIIRETYEQGEEAEKLQLPCFIPYECNSKTMLKRLVDFKSLFEIEPTPVVNPKSHLTNLHRIEVITKHREWENYWLQAKNDPTIRAVPYTCAPHVKQHTVKSIAGLKPISIREMNPRKNHVYGGYILAVKIIEEASVWIPSIHIVVEDENHDCERMHIYGFPEHEGQHFTSQIYTIGSKMYVVNPYLRIGAKDSKPTIRVDDHSSIIMQDESERIVNMCRCCGEANAPHVCGKCKEARYCSRECQTMDWQTYKHKLICKKK